MQILFSIIGIIITLVFVIGTHEAAHFCAARALGVRVLRFSIGFGKVLFRFHDKQGTEYVLSAIPLGGYVKMLDENEGNVPSAELPHAFNRQPYYKKFLIVLAGPTINILGAIVLYWAVFVIGYEAVKPTIGKIIPQSIAARAMLVANDEIIAIDDMPTHTWSNVVLRLLAHAGNQDIVPITVIKPQADKLQTTILNLFDWQLDGLKPDALQSIGIIPFEPTITTSIAKIAKDSPAARIPLLVDDKILAINKVATKDWMTFAKALRELTNPLVELKISRHDKPLLVTVNLDQRTHWFAKSSYYLGVSPKIPEGALHTVQYPPLQALQMAAQEAYDFTYFNFLMIWKIASGKISVQSLGGPITIFQSAGDAFHFGVVPFLSFLAFLSISIGVINLLPIPGLDGGHLFIYTLELVMQRTIPLRILDIIFRAGFAILIVVLVQSLGNDLLRLF